MKILSDHNNIETEERQKDKTEALFEAMQKQLQEHSTAELGILRGELNKQVTKISEVQKSMTLKIAEVEKSVSRVEEAMSTKISAVENSVANIRAVSYTHLDVYKRQAQQCFIA